MSLCTESVFLWHSLQICHLLEYQPPLQTFYDWQFTPKEGMVLIIILLLFKGKWVTIWAHVHGNSKSYVLYRSCYVSYGTVFFLDLIRNMIHDNIHCCTWTGLYWTIPGLYSVWVFVLDLYSALHDNTKTIFFRAIFLQLISESTAVVSTFYILYTKSRNQYRTIHYCLYTMYTVSSIGIR